MLSRFKKSYVHNKSQHILFFDLYVSQNVKVQIICIFFSMK